MLWSFDIDTLSAVLQQLDARNGIRPTVVDVCDECFPVRILCLSEVLTSPSSQLVAFPFPFPASLRLPRVAFSLLNFFAFPLRPYLDR